MDYVAYLERKRATCIDFTVKKDKDGKVLNPEVVSIAVQDKRDSCDINRVMKRVEEAKKRGEMYVPAGMRSEGTFGDFTNAPDLEASLNRVIKMNQEFMALPAEVRAKFDNDPIKLVAYLDQAKTDPKAKEDLVNLGVLAKPKFEKKKIETPEGVFWLTLKDGVEIGRQEVKLPAPTPAPK